jgi:hypothetical protein
MYICSVPMPPSVISAVEHASKKENMIAMVFRTKHNVILYDSSLIAGADHTHETNDDDIYNDPDYETENEKNDNDDIPLIADELEQDEDEVMLQD